LLDKTGTITLGNRQAVEFVPAPGVTKEYLADRAQLASLPDETPEGRSIVVLAKQFGLRARTLSEGSPQVALVAFSAATRMSGINTQGTQLRKGASDAIATWLRDSGGEIPPALTADVERILSAFPRLKMKQQFAETCCRLVTNKPETSHDNFLRDFGERFVPGYKAVSTVDLLMNAPFDE